jgi:hypothetical protein
MPLPYQPSSYKPYAVYRATAISSRPVTDERRQTVNIKQPGSKGPHLAGSTFDRPDDEDDEAALESHARQAAGRIAEASRDLEAHFARRAARLTSPRRS